MTSFRITGLAREPFAHLFPKSDEELAPEGIIRCVVDERPGFPDRITLRDLEVGERALLLNYVHQPAAGPYRASHAIFVGESKAQRYDAVGRIPQALRIRPLSLRAFDASGSMLDAGLVDGAAVESLIYRLLSNSKAAYVQAHYARRGCYAARIERAAS